MAEEIVELCNEVAYASALQCAAGEVAEQCLNLDYVRQNAEADSRRKDAWLHQVHDPISRVFIDVD